MVVKIRRAFLSEAREILSLFKESKYLTGSKEDKYTLKDILCYIKNKNLYVAVEENIIRGLITFDRHQRYLFLQAIVVSKKFQRGGIGTKLIEFVEKYARRKNIKQIEMFVQKNNKKMRKFIINKNYKKGKVFLYFAKILR